MLDGGKAEPEPWPEHKSVPDPHYQNPFAPKIFFRRLFAEVLGKTFLLFLFMICC